MKYSETNNNKPEFLNRIKAPAGFTNSVMGSIYKLEAAKNNLADEELRICCSRFYRKIGFSLVLTACMILISFFIPFLNNYQPDISKSINNAITKQQPPKIISGLAGVQSDIKSMFGSITDSVVKIKEGN
jgi:hypothetical protein